jgi:hypothetical protein
MATQEGSRWDVSIKSNAVCLERISDDEDRVSEDSLSSGEARDLAGLLTKFADKLDESEDSDKSDEDSDEDDESDEDSEEKSDDKSDKSDGA